MILLDVSEDRLGLTTFRIAMILSFLRMMDSGTLIASTFVIPSDTGKTVYDLRDSILSKVVNSRIVADLNAPSTKASGAMNPQPHHSVPTASSPENSSSSTT